MQCSKCGFKLPDWETNATRCPNCGINFSEIVATPKSNAGIDPTLPLALETRYKDAYTVAGVTVGIGSLIKGGGIALSIIFVVVGGLTILNGRLGDAVFALGVVILVFGVIAGIYLYILGLLVSANGQVLRASLDSAVNSSPFLTNDHRAKIMSLNKFITASANTDTTAHESSDRWRCICGGTNPKTVTSCQYCKRHIYATQ